MKQTRIHESTVAPQSVTVEHADNQVTNSRGSFGLSANPMGGGYYMAQFSTTD